MATRPPTTPNRLFADPRALRTSELLRRAASELAANVELSQELRVRAVWIEHARTDEGVSDERRRGVAAIEDAADTPAASDHSVVLRCTATETCNFHRMAVPTMNPAPASAMPGAALWTAVTRSESTASSAPCTGQSCCWRGRLVRRWPRTNRRVTVTSSVFLLGDTGSTRAFKDDLTGGRWLCEWHRMNVIRMRTKGSRRVPSRSPEWEVVGEAAPSTTSIRASIV